MPKVAVSAASDSALSPNRRQRPNSSLWASNCASIPCQTLNCWSRPPSRRAFSCSLPVASSIVNVWPEVVPRARKDRDSSRRWSPSSTEPVATSMRSLSSAASPASNVAFRDCMLRFSHRSSRSFSCAFSRGASGLPSTVPRAFIKPDAPGTSASGAATRSCQSSASTSAES